MATIGWNRVFLYSVAVLWCIGLLRECQTRSLTDKSCLSSKDEEKGKDAREMMQMTPLLQERCGLYREVIRLDSFHQALKEIWHYPSHVRLMQCRGGCVFTRAFRSCRVQMSDVIWLRLTLATREGFRTRFFSLQNATDCACACTKNATMCRSDQVWNENRCDCQCAQTLTCREFSQWDSQTCSCRETAHVSVDV